MSATLPTLFSIQGFMMWNFWSVYMSGELKSASNRRRQLTIMFGALVFDVVLLIIGALLLFHVAGYNFVYAVNAAPKAYAIPSGPFYSFLAALSVNIPFLTVIILGLTIWSVYSNVFQLVLGLIVLAGCLGVVIVAAAVIALPLRRPELY